MVVDPAGHVLGLVQQPCDRLLVVILDGCPVKAALLGGVHHVLLQRLVAGDLIGLPLGELGLGGASFGRDRLLQARQQRLLHGGDHIGPCQVAQCDACVWPFRNAIEIEG